ncbi:neurobeachin-like protein 1 isoform X4 [Crassostrea virginica]
MDELTASDKLFQIWMRFSTKNDVAILKEFIDTFVETYLNLIDLEFQHLIEGFSEAGPHFTKLPDGLLQMLSHHLSQCLEKLHEDSSPELIPFVESIIKCLIIISRNYDNVPLLGSCQFVKHLVSIGNLLSEKLTQNALQEIQIKTFLKLTVHFFECLYDPYFVWRKRLKGWVVDKSRMTYKPAELHVEVVPFFYDCCNKSTLSVSLKIRFLHLFGAVMCGTQSNALRVITPATLDILLQILSSSELSGPTNEQRLDLLELKDLSLKCIVCMVHMIHGSSPDQRQVEVSQVMEGYMDVLTTSDIQSEDGFNQQMQLSMIHAVNEMLSCQDRSALQVTLVSGGTFDSLVALLQKTSLTGSEAQSLAMSVLQVICSVLTGSINAKERFALRVGYGKFVEALKSLGQPSMALLKGVLNLVVEEEFCEGKNHVIRNVQSALMLLCWLPDIQSKELQIWLADHLCALSAQKQNKMNCCNEGMISAIIRVLGRQKQIDPKAVGLLINLLETLGTHSISAIELKQLMGHLKLDEEENQNPNFSRLMRALCTMARREGKEGAHFFLSLMEENEMMSMPGIRKWPGGAFSFHSWICLNSRSSPPGAVEHVYRRQLYSFVSNSGCGFEAFVTMDYDLVVSVYNRKEHCSVEVTDTSLGDEHWHSIDIVHSNSRRPFVNSHLFIYIDGNLKLGSQLKFPNVSESLTDCRIGSPCNKAVVRALMDQNQSNSSEPIKQSPLRRLFQRRKDLSDPEVTTIPTGTHEDVWGVPICLGGLLASVAIFHETISAAQVKTLYTVGPNHPVFFSEDDYPDFADLPSKALVYYNAKACKDGQSIDLSPNQNHGHYIGQRCVTWDIKDVINGIGGIQVLFPLLEQVNKGPLPDTDILQQMDLVSSMSPPPEQEDWVVVPSSSYSDSKLEQNQVSGFLTLLRHMIHSQGTNQEAMIRTGGVATIGALLQKVNSRLIDVNVLMSVQLLVETTASVNPTLLNMLYQYLLFDFRIWSSSEFPVRIGHIQYLSTIIKDDKKFFRKRFGVQFVLDTVRMFYSPPPTQDKGLSPEDMKTIRVSLMSLVKYYISRDISYEELDCILKFLFAVKDQEMVCEMVDVLISLLEGKSKNDQLHLLMFEAEMGELLYGLLVHPGKSVIYYEKIIKVLYLLLSSDKVYEKSKLPLRLTDIGHLGLVEMMRNCDISGPMFKRFLEQVSVQDIPQSYNSILALLQLIHYSGSDIKLEASRQLLSILVNRPGAAKQFVKQLGWQEAITKMFIFRKTEEIQQSDSFASEDKSVEFSLNDTIPEEMERDSESQLSDQCNKTVSVPSSLSISSCDNTNKTSSPREPNTPFYLSRTFDDINSSEDEKSRSVSRSSSTSVEDLTAVGQRSSSISASTSSFSISDSAIDLNISVTSSREKRVSSGFTQADTIQKALDNLGIQKICFKDTGERTEELCQNLLLILLTIMWKGVEGSDDSAWKERGIVISWVDKLCENHELIRSSWEIKRRLLEMMIHSCTSDLKEAAQDTATPSENAIQLVKLVHCFMSQDAKQDREKFSERLIEDLMALLDNLAVWDVESDGGWKEMARLGLCLLIQYASQPDLQLCAVATAKLHMLVQTKLISSSAEASFLIGNLNLMVLKAVRDKTDTYSFLIPVMKALLDKASNLLNLDLLLPDLPPTNHSPAFFDDFKTYCLSKQWTEFIENYVKPQMLHFDESTFGELESAIRDFWSECTEAMMVNMHMKNREKGESKLKFQNKILDPFHHKESSEQKRFHNVTVQQKSQHQTTLRQWRATKRFFTGERGAWSEHATSLMHWKLSNQENFKRMKVKMIPNLTFDPHTEASYQRDNLGASEADIAEEIKKMKLAREALVSKDQIDEDFIGEEDWSVISTDLRNNEPQGKEKLIIAEDCELVTMVDVIKGRLEVTTSCIYFFDCSSNREEGGEDFKWSLSLLREIHFRRYNLRRSAIELFMVDQTNFFLNFEPKKRNKVYSKILSLKPPNLIYTVSRSPAEMLRASGLTKKWIQREISNFEYLIELNTIAGRTYNDLSQYPVFPWILSDYTSDTLDLENPNVYRNLSKPIGANNPKNEREVKEKYDSFEDPSGVIEKFHYGTHYSNAPGVMHYMIRMEPFTTLHIQLQSNRFDVADRQFHSIPATWQSLMDNPNDVKELIPEFFYLSEFLVNANDFDLGRLQGCKERVNHVALPRWAKSPEDFIHKHRKALESEYVSANLHNWIDLIFGYKQKGPAAVEALNVFYYCTYEGAVDLDAVKDEKERKAIEGMINNFGQTPCQLLKEPHPRRMTVEDVVARAVKADRPLSVLDFLHQLKVFFVEVAQETDPLVYISVPRNQARSIIQHGMADTMVTISEGGIIGLHGWLPYDKSISNYFTFEKDPALANPKSKRRMPCPFSPNLKVDSKLFTVSHDAKLLFSVGHWDNSLQVYHLGKGKKVNHIIQHTDVVTCLALDFCGRQLITGSADTSCIVWEVIMQGGSSSYVNSKRLQTLYGHDAEITAVQISVELDTAVSASKDGTVIVHTVRRGHYMRTLRPPCTMGYTLNIPHMVMDDMGRIVLYCHETLPIEPKERFSLHLYSINGQHLCTERVNHGLGHVINVGDHLITGDSQGQLCIWETFGLRQLTVLPLHVPIHSLAITTTNSHIFAGLRDGKLIIIGVKNRSEIR